MRSSQGSAPACHYRCRSGLPRLRVCDGKGGCDSRRQERRHGLRRRRQPLHAADRLPGRGLPPCFPPVTCIERDCNSVVCNHATATSTTPDLGGRLRRERLSRQGTCQNGDMLGRPRIAPSSTVPASPAAVRRATGRISWAAPKLNEPLLSAGGSAPARPACASGVCELAAHDLSAVQSSLQGRSLRPRERPGWETPAAGASCDPKKQRHDRRDLRIGHLHRNAGCKRSTLHRTPWAASRPASPASASSRPKPDAGPPPRPTRIRRRPPPTAAPPDTRRHGGHGTIGKPKGGCHLAPSFIDEDWRGVGGGLRQSGPLAGAGAPLLLGLVLRRRR